MPRSEALIISISVPARRIQPVVDFDFSVRCEEAFCPSTVLLFAFHKVHRVFHFGKARPTWKFFAASNLRCLRSALCADRPRSVDHIWSPTEPVYLSSVFTGCYLSGSYQPKRELERLVLAKKYVKH
jgi:hypothetical protein